MKEYSMDDYELELARLKEELAEVRESESRFRMFAENVPDMIFSFDPVLYRFFYISPSVEKITGYSPQEIINDPLNFINRAVYPKDFERIFREYTECIESPQETKQKPFEYRIVCRNGDVIWINELRTIEYNQEGVVRLMTGIARDITERKNHEREREALLKKLQAALEDVKTLSGFLPICANCKKIRDDSGYWQQVESYIRDHSEAQFSHSICPDCAHELYPQIYKDKK